MCVLPLDFKVFWGGGFDIFLIIVYENTAQYFFYFRGDKLLQILKNCLNIL